MIRQKILQQLLEWIECNLEHPISIRYRTEIWLQQTQHPASVPKFHACAFGENTFANEGFVVPPFLSGSPRNLCLILHSLCILIHSSHSAANLKSYSAALPVNTATVIIGISQISSLLFLIRQQQKTECRLVNFPETPIFVFILNMILKCRINYRMKKSNCDVII